MKDSVSARPGQGPGVAPFPSDQISVGWSTAPLTSYGLGMSFSIRALL